MNKAISSTGNTFRFGLAYFSASGDIFAWFHACSNLNLAVFVLSVPNPPPPLPPEYGLACMNRETNIHAKYRTEILFDGSSTAVHVKKSIKTFAEHLWKC